MKTSQDRILTTHVGSLPRPPELKEVLVRKDQGQPYDNDALDRLTRQAVFDIVRRQAQKEMPANVEALKRRIEAPQPQHPG